MQTVKILLFSWKCLQIYTVFTLIFLDHLPEKEKNSFYHCNIPISDENVTCPNQKLLVRGDWASGYGDDCIYIVWMTIWISDEA